MTETRRALVVGASRGLGFGLVAELKGRGWEVVATAREPTGAARLATLGAQPGGRLVVEHVDITDAAGVLGLRHRMAGQMLDLLFVNAGISGPSHRDAARATAGQIAELFMTNAVGRIRLARVFLDLVRDGPGVVAFMSSQVASVAGARHGRNELYRASKAALNSLTRSFALELGDRRITVLAVAPGWVRTDLGGPNAPLSVEQSVRGIVDVLEARSGSQRHGFVDYRGDELRW